MKPYFAKMDDIGKPLRPAQLERMQASRLQFHFAPSALLHKIMKHHRMRRENLWILYPF